MKRVIILILIPNYANIQASSSKHHGFQFLKIRFESIQRSIALDHFSIFCLYWSTPKIQLNSRNTHIDVRKTIIQTLRSIIVNLKNWLYSGFQNFTTVGCGIFWILEFHSPERGIPYFVEEKFHRNIKFERMTIDRGNAVFRPLWTVQTSVTFFGKFAISFSKSMWSFYRNKSRKRIFCVWK